MADSRDLTANFRANTANFVEGVNKVAVSLTQINTKLVENREETKKTKAEISNLEKQQKALQETISSGVKSKQLEDDLKNVNEKLKQATARLGELKTNEQLLKVQLGEANKELKEQYADLNKVGENALSVGDIIKANLISEAIIGGVKRLGEGLKSLVIDSALKSDDINTLAAQYGLSTADIQKFQYASDIIDVSMETLNSTMAKNIRSMSDYRKGTAETVEAYKMLGVEVENADGSFRDSHTVYNEVISALGKMENATERDATAMKLLGRSAQEINPLILGGAEALAELGTQAENLGLILSQDELDNLNELNDKLDVTKANINALGMVVAEEFADSFDSIFEKGDEFFEFMQKLKADGTLDEMGQELAGGITTIVNVLETAIKIGWEYRDTIVAGAAALVAFKAAMSVGGAIASLVSSIKLITSANTEATVSQIALNTAMKANPYVLVASAIFSVISAATAYAIVARDSSKATAESARESLEKAKASREEADELKNLTEEYENLYKKTDITRDEKNRLVEIQEILNGKYLDEADRIDLVNGKYEDNINLLKTANEEKLKQAEREATVALYEANKASKFTVDFGHGNEIDYTVKEAVDEIEKALIILEKEGKVNTDQYAKLVRQMAEYQSVIDTITETEEYLVAIQKLRDKSTEETATATESLTDSTDDLTNSTEAAAEATTTAADRYKELLSSTKDLASEAKTLSNAFREQKESAGLSNETVLSLMGTVYSSALKIDEQTGRVNLNAEAFRDLAEAIYEAENAELQHQKTKLITQSIAAWDAGSKSGNVAEAQRIADDINAQIKDIDLQINLTANLKNSIDSIVKGEYGSPPEESPKKPPEEPPNTEKEQIETIKTVQYWFEKAAKDRLDLLDDELQKQKDIRDAAIKRIDDEIEARKRLNEDTEHQNEIDIINARLKYEQLDEFSRKQLEREKSQLLEEQAEVIWQREMQDKKDEANEEYERQEKDYKADIDEINKGIDTVKDIVTQLSNGLTSVSNVVNNSYESLTNNPVFNFSNSNFTESQLVKIVQRAISDKI